MKNTVTIILLVICLVLGFFLYTSKGSHDKLMDEVKSTNKIKEDLTKQNKLLQLEADDLRASKIEMDKEVVELNKDQEIARKSANKWANAYNKLVKIIPENLRDSLDNYQGRETALLGERVELYTQIEKCDSVKEIQSIQLGIHELALNKQDTISNNQKTIIAEMTSTQKSLIKGLSKERWKGRKEGGILGIILTILAFLAI